MSLRVATGGNVDAGKSTLTACLFGEVDDGRGAARATLFQHKHEKESGRTSTVTIREGRIGDRHVVLGDLPGHEKYFKTTISGLVGLMTDYVLIVVAANRGVTSITNEHFKCAACMNLPIIVVVSKIDLTPKNIRKETQQQIYQLCKKHNRKRYRITSSKANEHVISGCVARAIVPVVSLSCVTRNGMDHFHALFSQLPIWRTYDLETSCAIQIESIFRVKGVGIVVGGVCVRGIIPTDTWAYLGPFKQGEYKKVRVKSIFTEDVDSGNIQAGQYGTLAIVHKGLKRKHIHKGMVLTSDPEAVAIREIEARIFVLHHATTIKIGYTPIVHCRTVKKAAQVVEMNKDVIRSGDYARVTLRFRDPVFVLQGDHFVFRESRSKGVGKITHTR